MSKPPPPLAHARSTVCAGGILEACAALALFALAHFADISSYNLFGFNLWVHYAGRLCKALACFAVAWCFWCKPHDIDRFIAATTGTLLIGSGIETALGPLGQDSPPWPLAILDFGAVLCIGVGQACAHIALLSHLSSFDPRHSSVMLPVAGAASYTLVAAVGDAAGTIDALWVGALSAGALLGLLALRRRNRVNLHGRTGGDTGTGKSDTTPVSAPGAASLQAKTDTGLPVTPGSLGADEIASILFSIIAFPFFYGFATSINGPVSVSPAIENAASSAVIAVLLALAAVLLLVRRHRCEFDMVFVVVAPIYVGATLLMLVFGRHESLIATAVVVVRCGYRLFGVLLWILIARHCHGNPRHAFIMFGLSVGSINIMRMLGQAACLCATSFVLTNIDIVLIYAVLVIWILMVLSCILIIVQHNQRLSPNAAAQTFRRAGRVHPGNPSAFKGSVAGMDAPSTAGEDGLMQSDSYDRFAQTHGLSPRETQILRKYAVGWSAARIAESECISEGTVKTHLKHIRTKTGLHGRQELMEAIEALEGR